MNDHEAFPARSLTAAPRRRWLRAPSPSGWHARVTPQASAGQRSQEKQASVVPPCAVPEAWGESTAGRFPSLGTASDHRAKSWRNSALPALTVALAAALISAPTNAPHLTPPPHPALSALVSATATPVPSTSRHHSHAQPSLSSLIIPRDPNWSLRVPSQPPTSSPSGGSRVFFGPQIQGVRPVLVVTLSPSRSLDNAALLRVVGTTLEPVAARDSGAQWTRLAATRAVRTYFTYRSSFQLSHPHFSRRALPSGTLLQGELLVTEGHGVLAVVVLAVRASDLAPTQTEVARWLARWRWSTTPQPVDRQALNAVP